MARRTLVAGIGNIFLGDDGFGVEVARRLLHEPPREGIDVADFGIRGVHLAFEISSGKYDQVILVDAMPGGGAPGTLYTIEPEIPEHAEAGDDCGSEQPDAHSLTPAALLAWVRRIAGQCGRVVVVGCEPASVDATIGLSAPVMAAVDEAIRTVHDLIAESQGA